MDTALATREPKSSAASRLAVKPIDTTTSFRMQAYQSLKRAILEMDVYDHPGEIRLDERQLSQDLGVSRTPIREAMSLLEQEGFVKTLPRRGVFVVRKTKREIVEMILVWAALESMAARLVCQNATEDEIASLRHLFDGFRNGEQSDHLEEYSEQVPADRRPDQEPLHPYAGDPQGHDLRGQPRTALHSGPHGHRRGARGAGRGAR